MNEERVLLRKGTLYTWSEREACMHQPIHQPNSRSSNLQSVKNDLPGAAFFFLKTKRKNVWKSTQPNNRVTNSSVKQLLIINHESKWASKRATCSQSRPINPSNHSINHASKTSEKKEQASSEQANDKALNQINQSINPSINPSNNQQLKS